MKFQKKIVDAAESVYYLGEPSQTTLRVNIPGNIVDINLSSGKEVIFKIKTGSGIVDIVQSTSVNITGSLPTNNSTYIRRIKKAGLLDKNSGKLRNLKQETKLQKEDSAFRDININIENIHLSKNSKIGIVVGIVGVTATFIGIILSNGF